ncbi:hypothetical protein KCV87_21695 [Actinosynnema pretiosum subsp. pretiosum]|uniref:Uncharacterized protein n=1 Tax=Actinosynnema pretiosum subsp. pretiosum TaxID=103721 RepID=A0AA45R1V8_9PSEU|nr:hypothetical protein KCV87_21695 [Actinosynnema pretiosum subsp. pretiosum]
MREGDKWEAPGRGELERGEFERTALGRAALGRGELERAALSRGELGRAVLGREKFRKKELRRERFRKEELEREQSERKQSRRKERKREGVWKEALGRDVFEHGSGGVVRWALLLCRVLLLGWLLLALGVLPVPIQVGWETPVLLAAASVALVWAVLSSAGKWVRFRRS